MRRVSELLRRPTIFLAVGLIVSAFSGSVYLLAVNLAVSSENVLALNGLNILMAAISTGVMSGIEQEMVRAVSRAIARGLPTAPVIRRQVKQAGWFVGGSLTVCLVIAPVLTDHWLDGQWVLYAELMLGLAGTMVAFQVRGTLSGRQDFHIYAISLLVEALTRMLPSLALLALGCSAVWLYGLAFALGPVLSAVVAIQLPKLWHRPRLVPAEGIPDSGQVEGNGRAVANLSLLTGATLASQLLLNAVPLLVDVTYQHTKNTEILGKAAAITSAVGLARLGIVALLPIQTPLLPKLTTAAERGDRRTVLRTTLLLVGVCAGIGLVAVLVSAAAGPWMLHYLLHAHAVLPRWFLAALAAGTGFLMTGFILQAGLIAMSRHMSVMIGWGLGLVAMVPIFAIPIFTGHSDVLTVTAAGALAGPAVTAVFLAVDLWWSMRRRRTAPSWQPIGDDGKPTPTSLATTINP